MKNVTVLLNTETRVLYEKDLHIYKVGCLRNGRHDTVTCDKLFLCTQSSNIINIVKNSNEIVRNNWNSYNWLEQWSKNTYYIGFGFTINFTQRCVYAILRGVGVVTVNGLLLYYQ